MTNLKFRAILSKDEILYFTLAEALDSTLEFREKLIEWMAAGNEPDVYIGDSDMDGVEIYTDDIVTYKDECSECGDEIYDERDVVRFINGEFFPRPIQEDCGDVWYDHHRHDFKVIGNKTLNPELEA